MGRVGAWIGLLVWGALGTAHALDPWRTSSPGTRLVEVDDTAPRLDGTTAYFRDDDGAEYQVATGGGVFINCRPDPDAEWRAVIHGLQDVNANGIAGIIDDRLVVLLPLREAYIWSLRCAEVWDGAPDERVAAVSPRPRFEAWRGWSSLPEALSVNLKDTLLEIDGKVCAAAQVAVWCYDFDDPERGLHIVLEAADFTEIADGATLTQSLFERLWTKLFGGVRDNIYKTWTILSSRGLPDGTSAFVVRWQHVAIAQMNGGTSGPLTAQWLLLRHPDGTWETRFEGPPSVSSGTTHDFSLVQFSSPMGGSEIHYNPAWNALWVGPVLAWQTSGLSDNGREAVQGGLGYRVFPLDEPGSGYLDLTAALGEAGGCDARSPASCAMSATTAWSLPGGVLRMRLGMLSARRWPFELTIEDRDALDLDGDGLSRAEELALGTSDLDTDSDGDGAFDGPEVTLGGDPATADGDWHPPAPEVFIPSPLFGARYLPALNGVSDQRLDALAFATASSRLSTRGPFCRLVDRRGHGECVDVEQNVVAAWDQGSAYPPQVSWDGELLVYRTAVGFDVLELAGGATRPWIDLARLRPIYADVLDGVDRPDYFDLYPIDGDSLFVVNKPGLFNHLSSTVRVTHVDRAGEPSVVFDLVAEACAHGVGTRECVEDLEGWRHVLSRGRSVRNGFGQFALGYHAASERLMVGVGGSPESYIFGIHATEPPIELSRSRLLRVLERETYARRFDADATGLFPQFFIELSDGAYFTDEGLRGPRLEHPIPTPWAPQLFTGHGVVFHGVFGHTIVDQRGVEWVRSGRRVLPGDTLYLARDTLVGGQEVPGYMLFGVGPRGGANPLWHQPDSSLTGVTGMHLASDGRLCIADRIGRRLLELGPGETQVPERALRDVEVEAIDCHYDAADTLHVLLDDPPRTVVVEADGALGDPTPVAGDGAPAGIIDAPGGGFEVFLIDPADSLRGYSYDADGTRAEFRDGDGVDVDGNRASLSPEAIAHSVRRPDGSLILVWSALYETAAESDMPLVHGREPQRVTRDGVASPAAYIYPDNVHSAIAQVPGGEAVDPWSGAPIADGGGAAPGDAGAGDAGVDEGGRAASDAGDDGGCACDTSRWGAPAPWWLLLAVAALWRRRG